MPVLAHETMESVNARFCTEVIEHGNLDALASVYTPTATILPPDGPILSGLDAIKKYWSDVRQAGARKAVLTTVRVDVTGEDAYEIGTAMLTIEPENAAPIEVPVKYVVVWNRDHNGDWRWHVDIWNGYKPE